MEIRNDSLNTLRENIKIKKKIISEDFTKKNLILIDENEFNELYKNGKKIVKKIYATPYKSSNNVLVQKIKNTSFEKISISSKEHTSISIHKRCLKIQNLDSLKSIRNQGKIILNTDNKKQNKSSKYVNKVLIFDNSLVKIHENELSNSFIEGKYQNNISCQKCNRTYVKGENDKNLKEKTPISNSHNCQEIGKICNIKFC